MQKKNSSREWNEIKTCFLIASIYYYCLLFTQVANVKLKLIINYVRVSLFVQNLYEDILNILNHLKKLRSHNKKFNKNISSSKTSKILILLKYLNLY